MRLTAPFLVAALVLPLPALSATIHVPADQPTIQAGINVTSPGDTVLVANGTYLGPGNRNISFFGKAIVVTSEEGAAFTAIECEGAARGFRFMNDEDQLSRLSGFTIRNGVATGVFPNNWGGGVLCVGSSPTIEACVIRDCQAVGGSGGGIACFDSSPALINTSIVGNSGDATGGGVSCHKGSSPSLIGVEITSNHTNVGGGIYFSGSSISLTDCDIISNTASSFGGGLALVS